MKRSLLVLAALLLVATACDAPPFFTTDPPPADNCVSHTGATISTCEQFLNVERGGRNGDLNDTRWTAFRVNQATNPGAGLVNNFAVAHRAQVCMDDADVVDPTFQTFGTPPHDFYVCGNNSWSNADNAPLGPSHAYDGESVLTTDAEGHVHADNSGLMPMDEGNHWMEAMNDNEQYAAIGIRSEIPFDFASRTGTMVFDVDAKTEGTHSAWPEVWLTPEPMQMAHDDFPGTHVAPREGVELQFGNDQCGNNGTKPGPTAHAGERGKTSAGGLRVIREFHNFQGEQTDAPQNEHYTPQMYNHCITTQSDHANHFEVKISQTHIQVWASNDDGSNFALQSETDFTTPLSWSRGYWSFEHAQYAADKFNDMKDTTYHWHAIGWDGPVLPPDRSVQLDDANVARPDGTYNLGYQTPTATFNMKPFGFDGSPMPAFSAAYVTYNVYWYDSPLTLHTILNGHDYTSNDPDPATAGHRGQWHFIVQPVNLADVTDFNTLQITNTGCVTNCPTVANIDLELVP